MKKINSDTDNYTIRKIGIQRIRQEFDLDSQGMEENVLLHDT